MLKGIFEAHYFQINTPSKDITILNAQTSECHCINRTSLLFNVWSLKFPSYCEIYFEVSNNIVTFQIDKINFINYKNNENNISIEVDKSILEAGNDTLGI
jgi:hypothetical protein